MRGDALRQPASLWRPSGMPAADSARRAQDASFVGELRAIGQALPARRQTLLFSATLTRSLAALQAAALQDAFHFRV